MFDDVRGQEGFKALKSFWPENERFWVLLTTRTQFGKPIRSLKLDVQFCLRGGFGAYSEAELLYERALKISEDQLGENHPTTGTRLNNLADSMSQPDATLRQNRSMSKP